MRDYIRKELLDTKVSARLDRVEKRRKIVSVTPPIPISFVSTSEDMSGVLGQYLCPADGIITRVFAFVDKLEKDSQASVNVEVTSDKEKRSYSTPLRTGMAQADIEFPVYAGDRIEITIKNPDKISSVWFSCLYEIALTQATHEYFLISALEESAQQDEVKE